MRENQKDWSCRSSGEMVRAVPASSFYKKAACVLLLEPAHAAAEADRAAFSPARSASEARMELQAQQHLVPTV